MQKNDLTPDGHGTDEPGTTLRGCYRHPDRETGLRCAQCERYICLDCTTFTDVKNLCPDCVQQHENRAFSGGAGDYTIAVFIALPMSIISVLVFSLVIPGFGLFSWIIAAIAASFAGGLIGEAVRLGVKKRRSRYLGRIVAGTLAACCFLLLLARLYQGNLFGMIPTGILLFVGTGTILARLR